VRRAELVEALSHDLGVNPYGKWRGAFWRLISLAELEAGPTAGRQSRGG